MWLKNVQHVQHNTTHFERDTQSFNPFSFAGCQTKLHKFALKAQSSLRTAPYHSDDSSSSSCQCADEQMEGQVKLQTQNPS